MQEELEGLAYLATTNAMYIVKGEKHVFTNNGSYMTLLDKMKAHIVDKQEDKPPQNFQSMAMPSSSNSKDEVSIACCKAAAAHTVMLCYAGLRDNYAASQMLLWACPNAPNVACT